DVAEEAGVAVQSVYFTFHTKVELLQACYELAVMGEEDPLPPPEQPWFKAIFEAPTGPEALAHFAGGFGQIAARVAVLDDVVRAAMHEPEAVAVRANSEALRRDGYRAVAASLAGRFGLRAGLDVDRATDLLLVLAGSATYRQLVVDYGWDRDGFLAWLTASLAELVLAAGGE
ncbi:MAG TPA: hypothetical protein VMU09_05015, partial [Acidimicrobiales bacterium]|nr:hypothetical protein [Acidimicrobiales bacterium]